MRRGTWWRCRSAAVAWMACCVVWIWSWNGAVWSTPLVASAQEAKDNPAPADADEDLIDDAEPAAKPAPAAEPAAKAAPPAKQDDPAPAKSGRPFLQVAKEALGWFYITVFLLISFAFVALAVMNLLSARREAVCPTELVEAFEKHLDEKQYQEAYELAKGDESFLGLVLSAGLAKLSSGFPQAVEAMQEVGQEENLKLDQRLSYISLIGTISPMVGLFGTVDGMVRSFSVIADSTGTPPPSQLADGVARALWTTLVGLAIAIPAIAVHHFLKNRIDRLVLEVGIVSDGLMSRFENVGPRKK